jgi:hypothetical protein
VCSSDYEVHAFRTLVIDVFSDHQELHTQYCALPMTDDEMQMVNQVESVKEQIQSFPGAMPTVAGPQPEQTSVPEPVIEAPGTTSNEGTTAEATSARGLGMFGSPVNDDARVANGTPDVAWGTEAEFRALQERVEDLDEELQELQSENDNVKIMNSEVLLFLLSVGNINRIIAISRS